MESAEIVIGVDVGSTTVKMAAVDSTGDHPILWSSYERHETYQARTVLRQLERLLSDLSPREPETIRIFMTGSGAGPLAPLLGAQFVQEVNALTLAVEALHPDAGSVVELGGQDAKIVIYKENRETGERQTIASMNDKCASGTGATIDKCFEKLNIAEDELPGLAWDSSKLHHVAAKCGVFAETDIVNLMKSGVARDEIACSLADAVVLQNLSVLARGNTLRHKVILLGGPITYLPFLQAAWRERIRESWIERAYTFPRDIPLEDLIIVPDNPVLYPAYGTALFGFLQPETLGRFAGLERLRQYAELGQRAGLESVSGPPLSANAEELAAFRQAYAPAPFQPPALNGETGGYLGIDGGSTSSKAVLISGDGEVIAKRYVLSKGNPIADAKALMADLEEDIRSRGGRLRIDGLGVTGYAGDVLEATLSADVNLVETVAHMLAAKQHFPDVDVICDVGGQDIKILFLVNGEIRNFRLSNQCSAGNGMLLQAMARQFGVKMTDYADLAFEARLAPKFNYGCAVFLDADRVNFQREGYTREEIMAGLAQVLPKNIWQYVVQIPRMAELGRSFVLQGGTQYNLAAVKAQVDYIRERVPDAEVHVHPFCAEAGALGAALEARNEVLRRGKSRFIGLEMTGKLTYTTRNDASTVCDFCTNHCQRTFTMAETPDGHTTRFIAGFSCENGTVASKGELKTIAQRRKGLQRQFPNMVELEAEAAFREPATASELPADGTLIDDIKVSRTILGAVRRKAIRRGFMRSDADAARRRDTVRIGIPRVLSMHSTGPFWRAYFQTLGLRPENVVFSTETNEELWLKGGKYGSVDPCYPAKVVQAHIHQLLAGESDRRGKVDYIFLPGLTHIPSFLEYTKDSASCPIISGAAAVNRAAFTKDVNFFQRAGVEYVDPSLTLIEPNYLKAQMFDYWGGRLGVSQDESDHAIDRAYEALARFESGLQAKGRKILDSLEKEGRMGLLLLARPYHSDRGLNHGILEEFQALGYPILSIRSIPKDQDYLERYFAGDLADGRIQSVHDINDVWPEGYSTNSAEKVWAAKFAARHPNLAVLDLSSFKCGHDAPTYGLIDNIINAAGTPYMALHDIDANRPSGSINIRVKTFAYTLARHERKLAETARAAMASVGPAAAAE
ncbi:CoA activase [Zhengella mangrovi]|uniref:CoA activase n=1 Tax=Zhengella mangrovi TaxID=1982044 RepID=A0A2G1QJL4_9HYPH|nr:BadF/BadG/BcrA/BcrD ATPase family protein [Zhengella mangrovi]PHP65654.1 CoA activase [Zhengella mangrovi]